MNAEKIRRDYRITFSLTQDQADRIFAAAKSRELNVSELVRGAVLEKVGELGFSKQSADVQTA
jgi:hypothetical protein